MGIVSQRTLRRVVLFVALLLSGGMLVFPRLPMVLFVFAAALALDGFRFRIHRRLVPPMVFLGGLLAVQALHPQGFDLGSTFTRYTNFAAGLCLLGMYLRAGERALADDLFAILPWLAVQALLTVPLATFANFLFLPFDVDGTPYRTFLLIFTYHVLLDGTTMLPRPDGFFFEPGVFQIYLNVYLYLALLVFRRPRHVVLAASSVLATQSTTGIIILMLLFAFAAVAALATVSLGRKLAVLVAAVCIGIPVVGIAIDNIESKTVGEGRGSSWAREYDLYTGLNVIAEHPWLGIGFNYQAYYALAGQLGFEETQLSDYHLEDRGNTNGIVTLFYSLGIPLGLVFVAGLFRQRFFPHRGLFGICMMLSLFGEALFFSPFISMLLFSGLTAAPRRPRAALSSPLAPT